MSQIASLLIAVLFIVGGIAFGYADSRIPAPEDAQAFWLGNLIVPWLLIPFLAGWAQRTRVWAVVTGVLTLFGCVLGFYGTLLSLNFRDGDSGNDIPGLVAVAPWFAAAFVAGIVYSLLGRWWGESKSLIALLALGAVAVVEPLLWLIRLGYLPTPGYLWAIEVAAGIVFIVLARALRPGRRPAA